MTSPLIIHHLKHRSTTSYRNGRSCLTWHASCRVTRRLRKRHNRRQQNIRITEQALLLSPESTAAKIFALIFAPIIASRRERRASNSVAKEGLSPTAAPQDFTLVFGSTINLARGFELSELGSYDPGLPGDHRLTIMDSHVELLCAEDDLAVNGNIYVWYIIRRTRRAVKLTLFQRLEDDGGTPVFQFLFVSTEDAFTN